MTEIIIDTDIGSDCDDVMALSYLISAAKSGQIKISAVTVSHRTPFAYKAVSALFSAFGETMPLFGQIKTGLEEYADNYCRELADRFYNDGTEPVISDAVCILRRALTNAQGKAILCGIGPATNIARLIRSGPDEISPLDGRALLKEKCSKIVMMAGEFRDNTDGIRIPEWNVKCDIDAAKTVVENCDNEIVMLPYEVGADMITGEALTKEFGCTHPLTCAFITFNKGTGGRHSWDPATVLYAVQGCGDFFSESASGIIKIGEHGETFFTSLHGGHHKILSVKLLEGETVSDAKKRTADYINGCVKGMYCKTEEL